MLKRIEHINGTNIFLKLKVYLCTYMETWRKNRRVKDVFNLSKSSLNEFKILFNITNNYFNSEGNNNGDENNGNMLENTLPPHSVATIDISNKPHQLVGGI